MWLSGLSVDTAGAQRICGNVSTAAWIGGGGQLLLPGGSIQVAAIMFVIAYLLLLLANLQWGKP